MKIPAELLPVRRAIALVLIPVLVGLATSVPASGATLAVSPRAPAATSDSLATGIVTRDGVPVSNAILSVAAYPSASVLAALPTGGRAELLLVDTVVTDAFGGFNATVDWTNIPTSYRDSTGGANFQIVASAGTQMLGWNLSGAPVGSGLRAASLALSGVGGRPDRLTFEFGRDSGVGSALQDTAPTDGLRPAGSMTKNGLHAMTTTRTPSVRSAGTGVCCSGCYAVASNWYYGIDERFAAVYAWGGAYGTITQTYGSTHTLGVAAQLQSGAWQASGTSNLIEVKGTGAIRGGIADAWVYNKVNYRDFALTCPPWTKTRQAVSNYGLLTAFNYAGHPYWSACSHYTGGTYWKSSGTQTTFSTGVTLGILNVSAQSGWDTATEMKWDVTSPTWLCGNTSQGWASAPQAEAHSG